MALTLRRFDDVDAFLAVAEPFLEEREAEHNLIFGISGQVRATPSFFTEGAPSFAVVTAGDGRVVLATVRTPPNYQVLSQVDDLGAVDVLVDGLAGEALPGVLGPKEASARFAERWSERTGGRAELERAERIFRLERVIPPERPPSGAWRLAEPRHRELIAAWLTAFRDEAAPGQQLAADAHDLADRWIAQMYRRLYLWEADGRVVSMVGAGGETPSGIRIGPVYTPPGVRRRGYASALTAAASQDQLDRGRRFAFLFTDLANPTSNKIYQAIGYEPVCDMDMYRLVADA